MIDVLTTRTSIQEWKNELNRSMKAAGIKRKDEIYEQLEEGLRKLVSIINEFRELQASIMQPGYRDEHDIAIRVEAEKMDHSFFAFITYTDANTNRPSVEINYTERPTTKEFPIEGGTKWKIVNLKEREVKDPLYVIAYVKNCFIQYESFRRIGNSIIYSILEE